MSVGSLGAAQRTKKPEVTPRPVVRSEQESEAESDDGDDQCCRRLLLALCCSVQCTVPLIDGAGENLTQFSFGGAV